ncbi:MAG: zinc-binding dehydrogenase [Bacteroidota bacterium]
MKAAVITKFGSPSVLKIQDWPEPAPQKGEVKIRVKAIGLNFADVMARLGLYPSIPKPPFIPGIEVSGIVTKVGENVRKWRRGDRVIAFTQLGGYAEYAVVKQEQLFPLPKRMNFEEGAAFSVAYLTAYHGLLTLGHVHRGDKLLIHAAAGGVGIAATQMARHLGAEVFATASTSEKLEIARSHGATHLINYQEEDFEEVIRKKTNGYGIDVVLDSVGGTVFKKGWKILAPMGRYVLFGFSAITGKRTYSKMKAVWEMLAAPILFPHTLLSRNVSLSCFNLYFLAKKSEYLRNALRLILDWQATGILKPVIGARYPFSKIAEAQAFMQSRKSIGKIVITLD